ncbi:MAG: helix-turn-helix transcriptional regulator [Oscillospiraceae bacterium]|nr:helix-turn-helix transcriptional regulator [Oscillospiraceae bacterium]
MVVLNVSKIKQLMTAQRISNEEISKRCGVGKAMVSYIINGKKQPSLNVTKSLADCFNLNVDDIILDVGESNGSA